MKWVWITIKEVGFSSNQLTFESPHPPAALVAPVHKWDCSCKKKKKNTQVFFHKPWCRDGSSFSINLEKTPPFLCMWLASPGLRTFHYFSPLVIYVNNIKTNLLLGKIAWCKWKGSLWSVNLLPHKNSSPSLLSLLKWELGWDAAAVCTFISGVNMKDQN